MDISYNSKCELCVIIENVAFHILVFLDTWDQSHLLNLHNKLLNLNLTVRDLSSLFSLLKDKCYLKLYLQH